MCMSVGASLRDAVKYASFAPTAMPALRTQFCGRSGFDEARADQPGRPCEDRPPDIRARTRRARGQPGVDPSRGQLRKTVPPTRALQGRPIS